MWQNFINFNLLSERTLFCTKQSTISSQISVPAIPELWHRTNPVYVQHSSSSLPLQSTSCITSEGAIEMLCWAWCSQEIFLTNLWDTPHLNKIESKSWYKTQTSKIHLFEMMTSRLKPHHCRIAKTCTIGGELPFSMLSFTWPDFEKDKRSKKNSNMADERNWKKKQCKTHILQQINKYISQSVDYI